MMFNSGAALQTPPPVQEELAFRGLQLTGKFLAMDKQDYPCIIDTITETQMSFLTVGPAVTNYSFICYMDVVGRLPGTICGRIEGGFLSTINLTESRMARVIERLEWYQNHRQAQQQAGEARQHDRQSAHVQAELRLMNGATYPCEILDVSFSGALIQVDPTLELPREFWLIRDDASAHTPCAVRWRIGGQIGVMFIAALSKDAANGQWMFPQGDGRRPKEIRSPFLRHPLVIS